jgi:hypothetical protein
VRKLRYEFSLDVITRKPKEAKQAALSWCHDHGLQKPFVRDVEEGCGWACFSVFSAYLQNRNYLTLENGDAKGAFKELLKIFKKIDCNVRVRTDWLSLEQYIQLESKVEEWAGKTLQIQSELDSEESKLSRGSSVFETENFDVDEDILQRGTREEILKQLNAEQNRKSHRMPLLSV